MQDMLPKVSGGLSYVTRSMFSNSAPDTEVKFMRSSSMSFSIWCDVKLFHRTVDFLLLFSLTYSIPIFLEACETLIGPIVLARLAFFLGSDLSSL